MDNKVLLFKLLIACICAAATVGFGRWRRLPELSERAYRTMAFGLLLLSRLGLFAAVFIVARLEPQSDVGVYYDLARHAMAGQVPFRDFFNAYGPLAPYVTALPVLLWDSTKAIVLFSILMEVGAFAIWLKVGARLFDTRTRRLAGILYVTSPIALLSVALSGQNHVWIAFFLALAVWLTVRMRDGLSGFSLALSVIVVKFLSLLFAPVLFLMSGRRWIWLLCCVAPLVLVYGTLALFRIDFLGSVAFHSLHSSSGNLPYLLTVFGINWDLPVVKQVFNAIGAAVLGAVFLAAAARYRPLGPQRGVVLMALVLLITLVVSKKSFAGYLVTAFYPLAVVAVLRGAGTRAIVMFAAFGIVATLESSLMFRWMMEHDLRVLWYGQLPEGMTRARVLVFTVCEVALLGYYVAYACQAWRALSHNATQRAIEPVARA